MRGWWHDLVVGLRAHRKTPLATLVVVLTLAFAMAANAAAFALLNGLFLRPLPVDRPDRIVRVYSRYASGLQYFTLSYPDYADIGDLGDVFAGVVAEELVPLVLGLPGSTERVWGEQVAGGYFDVLGVGPAAGRFFTREEEDARDPAAVVVLGHALWQRRFGGRPDVVGDTIPVNGRPAHIVGVAPRDFSGVTLGVRPELWRPRGGDRLVNRGGRGLFVAGRLQPGVTVAQAGAALDVLARRLQQKYPATNRGIGFSVLPESDSHVHPMIRGGVLGLSSALSGAAGLMLLVACANVAGVLLVRATRRRREMGLRLALGAAPGRIVRQLLVESAMLALVASAVGLALARAVMQALGAIELPTRVPLFVDLGLDARVLGFSVAVTVLTAVLCGLAPALESARGNLVAMLNRGDLAGGLRPSRLRGALVAVQVAVTLTLLVGGGLFLKSLRHAHQLELGFDPRGLVTASADLGLQGYAPADARAFWRDLVARLAARPEVEAVSLASTVPFELNITRVSMGPDGYEPPAGGGWPSIDWAIVDAGYFETMEIPLVEGRGFDDRDTESSPPVIVVNEVVRLVVRQSAWHVLVGLAVGLLLGLVGSRLLGGLLYGVSPTDPVVFGLAPAMLLVVAVVAALVPALRAIRIDPAIALRHE